MQYGVGNSRRILLTVEERYVHQTKPNCVSSNTRQALRPFLDQNCRSSCGGCGLLWRVISENIGDMIWRG